MTTLTIKQACAEAGVSRRTLYNWMDHNKIQYVRTAGGSRRILAESLFRAGNCAPGSEDSPAVSACAGA